MFSLYLFLIAFMVEERMMEREEDAGRRKS